MAQTSQPARVVAVGDPGATQQQITAALSSQPDLELVDVLSSPERLARDLGAATPDIILIDHMLGDQPTLDIIDDIAQQFPDSALIAILPESDPVLVQQVLLAGARGFVIQPFTQINLLSTLRRVHELESRRQKTVVSSQQRVTDAMRPLRAISVFSPRGGVGTTTIAANLALAMHEATQQRVLLIEGKLAFGHLDVLLNIRTQNTIADLIPHASALDDALIQDVVFEHGSGLHVLLAPSNLQVAQGIRPDDLYTVFIQLLRRYDLVVIDAGSSLNDNSVTLMDSADKILLVTNPDLAALHDVSRFVQVSRSLGYSPEKFLFILNREGMTGGIRTNDINAALNQQPFARIPDDTGNATRSVNRGIPLLLRYPRSPASRAIKDLSKRLVKMQTADLGDTFADSAVENPQREALLVSSQLG